MTVTASRPVPSMKYVPQLDGLRAVAIIMVFLHHAFNIPLLWAGVDLFFILSGYLITNILLRDCETLSFRKMIGKFYLRRAERILPAYTVFLLLVLLLDRKDLLHIWPYFVTFLQNIPFAFHFVPWGPLVPLWSLAVEQHFFISSGPLWCITSHVLGLCPAWSPFCFSSLSSGLSARLCSLLLRPFTASRPSGWTRWQPVLLPLCCFRTANRSAQSVGLKPPYFVGRLFTRYSLSIRGSGVRPTAWPSIRSPTRSTF